MVRKPEKSSGELVIGCAGCIGAALVQLAFWAIVIVVGVAIVKWALIHV